jgi:putative tricarboxylic transport membrane protein
MNNTKKFHAELIFNLVLMIIGAVILIESLRIGFGTLKSPGSGLFTFLAGLLIFFPNLVMTFRGKSTKSEIVLDRYGIKNFIFMSITLGGWLILLPFMGYIVVTFIATFVLSKIMKLEGWPKPLLLSAGTTALCYILFDYILYLDLPRGFLG